jgi:hypothetical protein
MPRTVRRFSSENSRAPEGSLLHWTFLSSAARRSVYPSPGRAGAWHWSETRGDSTIEDACALQFAAYENRGVHSRSAEL